MLSNEQQLQKERRIKLVVDTFLENENVSIDELSQKLKISSSTIQRDLNNIEEITSIYGAIAKEKLIVIRDRLKRNKQKGTSLGGTISTTLNVPIRDKNGKFTGNKKR